MPTLHLIPHTHWDREWYRSFEEFRFRLVKLVDKVLEILHEDPGYRTFLLDGQTIVLEDYLTIRPEKRQELVDFVQQGRIQIGPWYILPDEFLVSPEATIRNLLLGQETAREFGPVMQIGYLPDTFGHIGQIPQIVKGFGMQTACAWRGLPPLPYEVIWQAPDGSQVYLINLHLGYGNAYDLMANGLPGFTEQVAEKNEQLAGLTRTPHRLLMFGTDHQMPHEQTAEAVRRFRQEPVLDLDLQMSTLPAYAQAAMDYARENNIHLPVITGELRTCPQVNLLPGVLSARVWIKQRNAYCENLLERWVEPSDLWQTLWSSQPAAPSHGYTNYLWKTLVKNHPHDSICGCSVDAVHEEMRTRFDKVEQAGELLVQDRLDGVAQNVDGSRFNQNSFALVTVFNPLQYLRTDVVTAQISLPPAVSHIKLVDEQGKETPVTVLERESQTIANFDVDREGLLGLTSLLYGGTSDYGIQSVAARQEGETGIIEVVVEQGKPTRNEAVQEALEKFQEYIGNETIQQFSVRAHTPELAKVQFTAADVPGFGYRTWGLLPAKAPAESGNTDLAIENEFLRVSVEQNGTLTLHDVVSQTTYTGLHYFSDGSDVGDEYNYSPAEQDFILTSHDKLVSAEKLTFADHAELHLTWEMPLPAAIEPNRKKRSAATLPMRISSRIAVFPGVRRVQFATEVVQNSDDHRLRVHFDLPFRAETAWYDGHFDVVERPVIEPRMDADWVEQRRPEVPQRAFCDASDGTKGLMLAVKGLPEVSVNPTGEDSMDIALTLLRCVGWLSRDDFSTRKGHAGPMLPTPGAQMHGSHHFEYALIPHQGQWPAAMQEGYGFSAPMKAAVSAGQSGSAASSRSWLQVEPQEFLITTIKLAEDNSGWIVRGVNLSNTEIQAKLVWQVPLAKVSLCNMAEQENELLPLTGNTSQISVRPKEVITLKIVLA